MTRHVIGNTRLGSTTQSPPKHYAVVYMIRYIKRTRNSAMLEARHVLHKDSRAPCVAPIQWTFSTILEHIPVLRTVLCICFSCNRWHSLRLRLPAYFLVCLLPLLAVTDSVSQSVNLLPSVTTCTDPYVRALPLQSHPTLTISTTPSLKRVNLLSLMVFFQYC
jgi:hypothetical protein